MPNKRRCSYCKEYFTAEEMLDFGVGGVCSSECLTNLQQKYRNKRDRRRSPVRSGPTAAKYDRVPGSVRLQVRERDRDRCRGCGTADGRLEKHHVLYRSEGGPHLATNLILLCDVCHRRVHSDKRTYQRVLLYWLMALYTSGKELTLWKLLELPPEQYELALRWSDNVNRVGSKIPPRF